ncbi:hypothetical protein PMAYCL1PPCAC_15916, partial [Pristionchus mayeri]
MLNIAVSCSFLLLFGFISLYFHLGYIHKDKTISALSGEFFSLLNTISVPLNTGIFVFSQPKLKREYQMQLRKRFRWIP